MKVKGSSHTAIFSKYIELLPLKTFLGYFGNKRFSKQKYKKRGYFFKMADMDNNKLPGLLIISWSDLLLSQEHIKERRERRLWVCPWKRDSMWGCYSIINNLRLTEKEFWKKICKKTLWQPFPYFQSVYSVMRFHFFILDKWTVY